MDRANQLQDKARTFEVVTTTTRKGFEDYGRRMLQTFDQHWPTDVKLVFYAEGFTPDVTAARLKIRDLLLCSPELVAFKNRHSENPLANGRSSWLFPRIVNTRLTGKPRIRPKLFKRGHRWQAVRFAHKSFAIFHAAAMSHADVLIWIDADTRFFDDVGYEELEGFVPEDRFVGCLMRRIYTECGFVAYNLRHPATAQLLSDMKRFYTEDRLFGEEEYHDSYLFDIARQGIEQQGHRSHDIAEGIGMVATHVLINSRLGRFMDHMKGDRKGRSSSRTSDLVIKREETYWTDMK